MSEIKIDGTTRTGCENGDSRVINQLERTILDRLEALTIFSKTYLTVEECAKYLGLKPETIRRYMYDGELSYCRPSGKNVFISRKDLDEFVEKGRVVSNAELSARASDYIASK